MLRAVEETLNAILDAEADELVGASKYQRSPDRQNYRSGHYTRMLHAKAGEVGLQVPKLGEQTFETAIIERYRRRESVEEVMIEMYWPACPFGGWKKNPPKPYGAPSQSQHCLRAESEDPRVH